MQTLSFYRFPLSPTFSGNADPLLLPFNSPADIFGQCKPSPFTIYLSRRYFRAMQTLCFSRFPLPPVFSGNANPLLFPFLSPTGIFGQCKSSAFPVSLSHRYFRAMQTLCFSPILSPRHNAHTPGSAHKTKRPNRHRFGRLKHFKLSKQIEPSRCHLHIP
jgi:hypothetical protein